MNTHLNTFVPYTIVANILPDKSSAVLMAAPVFSPNVLTIPNSMGTSARGMTYLGVPAFLASVMAAMENVSRPVPITLKREEKV